MPDTAITLPSHGSHGWDVVLNTALTTLCTALNAERSRALAAEDALSGGSGGGSGGAHPYVVVSHAGLVGLTSALEGSTALVLDDGSSVAAFYVLIATDPTVDGNWHQIPYDPAGAAAAVLATAETFATNAVAAAVAGLAAVARTGSYADLSGKPTLGSAAAANTSAFDAAGAATTAQATAISTAASDATTKANTAQTTAEGYTDTKIAAEVTRANAAYDVAGAAADLVASAPALLDTLKELADALGDDPNFATTMTNALALKADASALGTAAARNVEDFDAAGAASTAQTTAEEYTDSSINELNLHNMSQLVAFDGNTTSYTPSDTDDYQRSAQNPIDASGGPVSLLMTREVASGSSPRGQWVLFIKADSSTNTVTIAGDGLGTIDGDSEKSVVLRLQGQSLLLFLNGRSGGDWATFAGELPLDGLTSYLDPRYTLSDGGSLQQWVNSTSAARGSVWAYQGSVYERNVDGTGGNIDATFVRANWTLLGADPTVVGGGDLGTTVMSSSVTPSLTASLSTFVDITGLTIAPIVPSSGRGIFVELDADLQYTIASAQVFLQLWDVTAGAAVPGLLLTFAPATAAKPWTAFKRWKLTPAAGARTYKVQASSSAAGFLSVYGTDFNGMTTLAPFAR